MAVTLEQQLTLEARICPQCKCELSNPFITRCPRCLTIVPIKETACGACIHRKSCPVIHKSFS